MTERAPEAGVQLLQAVRRRWWLVVGAPVATATISILFVLWVRPVFEATTTLRFTEEQSPFGGAVAGAVGEGGGGGLSLLASLAGRSVPIQSEMAVMSSRSLAGILTDELGLRMELRAPKKVARRTVFSSVSVSADAAEGDYELTPAGDGTLSVSGEVLVGRDPFKPFLNEEREVRELGAVRPGETLPIAGARIVVAPGALDVAPIRLRVLPWTDALDRVQERVVVSKPERDADMVQIAVRWTDPELAATMAERLAVRFMERRERVQAEQFGRTAGFLSSQLDSLQGELEGAEEALRGYREAEGIVEPEAQATAAVEQLAELQARRDLLAAERQALLVLLEEIRAAPEPAEGSESPYRRLVFFPTLLQNTATAELLRLLGELENDRAELFDRRTPGAREVRVLTDRIRGLEGQLRTVAETYLEGLGNQVASFDETLRAFETQLERVPAVELEYLRRRRQVEVLTQLYVFMQMSQKEAEVTAAGEAGGVRVVDAAVVPIEPETPKPALTLGLALVVGLIVGVGGAVVLEHARAASPAA